MNAIQEPRMDNVDRALAAFVFPFNAIQSAAKLAATAFTHASKKASEPQPPEAEVAKPPEQAKSPIVFRVADRVHSHMYGQQKVYFYLYGREQIIRATARRDGKEKELLFTPAIAQQCALPFTLEAAVRWIGEVGFKKGTAPTGGLVPKEPVRITEQVRAEKVVATSNSVVEAKAEPQATARRPFEGSVVSFGTTQRPPQGDKPGYTTYYLKLHSNLIGEREFIGEQLAELVEQYKLEADQRVRLHPLGKRTFSVVVDGKTETRKRNEYAIELL